MESEHTAAVTYEGMFDSVGGERPNGSRFVTDRGHKLVTTPEHAKSLISSGQWRDAKKGDPEQPVPADPVAETEDDKSAVDPAAETTEGTDG